MGEPKGWFAVSVVLADFQGSLIVPLVEKNGDTGYASVENVICLSNSKGNSPVGHYLKCITVSLGVKLSHPWGVIGGVIGVTGV